MAKIIGKLNKKKYLLIRESLDLLRINSRYVNHIRLHANTTVKHMKKICEICIWLRRNGYDFVTEAEWVQGGRADIFVLSMNVAYEVLDSETIKQFNKKDYPVPTYAIMVNSKWKGL